jgi:hypothetical protein
VIGIVRLAAGSEGLQRDEHAESNEMVVATDFARVADAIGPSPSGASLRGLDGVNLLLAGALSGFGPYVAAFLAEQNWTQQSIGFVLTAGGFAGLLSQLPGGALLDAVRSKRAAVALGAVIIAVWPNFPLVLIALVLQGVTGGFLRLAIVAISLGLVGNTALAERPGRNQRFASMGGVVAARRKFNCSMMRRLPRSRMGGLFCRGHKANGGSRHNGGYKHLNLLILLEIFRPKTPLRREGRVISANLW